MNIENFGKDFKNSTPKPSAGFWQEFEEMVTEHENSKNVEMEHGVVGQIGMTENKLSNSRSMFTIAAGLIIFSILGIGIWSYVQNNGDSQIASIDTTGEEDKINLSLLDALGAEAYIYQTDEAEPSELVYVVDSAGTNALTDMGELIDGYFVSDSFLVRDFNGLPACDGPTDYLDGTEPVAIEKLDSFIKIWFEDRSAFTNDQYPGVDEFELPFSSKSCTDEETVSDVDVVENITTISYSDNKISSYKIRNVNYGITTFYDPNGVITNIENLDGVSLIEGDSIINYEASVEGILVYETSNSIVGVSGETGNQLWSIEKPGSLAGLGKHVLVLTRDGASVSSALVLDIETGETIKKFNNFENDVIEVIEVSNFEETVEVVESVSDISEQELAVCEEDYDRVSNLDRETLTALEFDTSDIFQSTEGSAMTVYYEDSFPVLLDVVTFGEIGRAETYYELYNDDDYGYRGLNYRYKLPFDDENAEITEEGFKTCETIVIPNPQSTNEIDTDEKLAGLLELLTRAEDLSQGVEVG